MLFRLTIIGAMVCGALLAGSIFYRMHKDKPILRPEFSELRFADTWSSGRSDRSILARMVGARHVLWVAVTKETLHISPHFPVNLMFFAEAFGWDHRVPGRTIIDISKSGRNSHVTIRYRHKTGDEEKLELAVKNVTGLLDALREVRGY